MVVPDDQLSLAIGKEGQNARLAAKLTGFKIDIKPASNPGGDEDEERDEVAGDECPWRPPRPPRTADEPSGRVI